MFFVVFMDLNKDRDVDVMAASDMEETMTWY